MKVTFFDFFKIRVYVKEQIEFSTFHKNSKTNEKISGKNREL